MRLVLHTYMCCLQLCSCIHSSPARVTGCRGSDSSVLQNEKFCTVTDILGPHSSKRLTLLTDFSMCLLVGLPHKDPSIRFTNGKKLSFAGDVLTVLSVGLFLPVKGQDLLFKKYTSQKLTCAKSDSSVIRGRFWIAAASAFPKQRR